MHETHIIKPIIQKITDLALEEQAGKVSCIRLKIGELTGLKEESFKTTFSILAKGTLLETAELDLVFFMGSDIEVISFDMEESD